MNSLHLNSLNLFLIVKSQPSNSISFFLIILYRIFSPMFDCRNVTTKGNRENLNGENSFSKITKKYGLNLKVVI